MVYLYSYTDAKDANDNGGGVKAKTMMLLKYGKREHLESIKNGYLYFNPICKYRNDGTAYRGDNNEGIIPVDPSTLKIFDDKGNNLLKDLPPPSTVKQHYIGDDGTLLFCTSILDRKILEQNGDHFIFRNEYKRAISEFGDHVLLFHSAEIIDLLNEATKRIKPEFGYVCDSILYRNLEDYSIEGDYLKAYRMTGSDYDPYFVKDKSYEMQNEWRLIIDGLEMALPVNSDGSYMLYIGELKNSYLYETSVFLDNLSIENG